MVKGQRSALRLVHKCVLVLFMPYTVVRECKHATAGRNTADERVESPMFVDQMVGEIPGNIVLAPRLGAAVHSTFSAGYALFQAVPLDGVQPLLAESCQALRELRVVALLECVRVDT